MRKPKIKDISRIAGVSPATVSRVLNGNGYASEEKHERVMQALRTLGYDCAELSEPKSIPQVLIVSFLSLMSNNRLFSNILETVCLKVQKLGWQCIIHYLPDNDPEKIYDILKKAGEMELKGIIFNCVTIPSEIDSIRRMLRSLPFPVVTVERTPDIFGLDKIMINAKETLFLAVKHLYKNGHRKIAFFSPEASEYVERSRIEGFEMSVNTMNLDGEAHFAPIENYSSEQGYNAIGKYVEKYGLPTAVVCADSVMVGVCRYLYENEIRVPGDVSLIGLDDTNASIMTPALTSVAFPVEEIANTAIQLMADGKSKNKLARSISLSTYLVERNSVAKPRED